MTKQARELINWEQLSRNESAYKTLFHSAQPFEHCVIDNFLTPEGLEALDVGHLMVSAASNELSSDFIFAKAKIESPKIGNLSDALAQFQRELMSQKFEAFLQSITGLQVFLDPDFVGGGLHQGGADSFLEMHADFSRHPRSKSWIRELNILLYLNRGWRSEWGGSLDLRHASTGEATEIEPIENRLVIMLSKGHTLHGYKKITFPPDLYRTSIAAYAYTHDDGTSSVPYSSTQWVPDSRLKAIVARVSNKLVPLKHKWLGSRTAKRAK